MSALRETIGSILNWRKLRLMAAIGCLVLFGCVGPSARVYVTQGEPGSPDADFFTMDVQASPNPHSVRAVKCLKEMDHTEAEAEFREAVRENPHDHRSWFGLGALLESTQRHAEAHDCLRTAVEITNRSERRYVRELKRIDDDAAVNTRPVSSN